MNIAIVDDLASERKELLDYLTTYCTENRIHAQFDSYDCGTEFLKKFHLEKYDLIFLDIYMEDMDGIQVAEKVRETDSKAAIIFSTTSRSHAVEGFRVRAFDYLVKPYSYETLKKTMNFCTHDLLKHSHYIEVKEGRCRTKVLVDDIIYTDYYNHYIQIHTDSRVIRSYMPFTDFSPLLDCYPQFLSCYRNCLINMDKVTAFAEKDFIMESGERIPVSRGLKNAVRQAYSDYVFGCINGEL